MTPETTTPDTNRHPGLRLMEATAAVLRGAPVMPGDVVGGAFLEDEAPAALSANAAEQAFARIDALQTIDSRARSAAGAAGRELGEVLMLPDPLREAVFDAMGEGRRWKFLGFGIRSLKLPMDGGGETQLLRIEPGANVAEHDHQGEEYTLVVTGAFHDGHDRYGPGDVNVGRPGFSHEPKAEPGEVCYALAVSFGQARFGFPVNILQKLTGH
jgi:putative transcriptional regulator